MDVSGTALWTSVPQAIAVVAAYIGFAVASIVLTAIDLRTHRLPNRIVAVSGVVGIGCLGAAALGGGWQRFVFALIGMAALFGFYLMLRMVSSSGIGGGDVKLAAVVGLHLGWLGVTPLLAGAVAGFVLGGVWALWLLGRRRATRDTRIAFGPFMLAGAWLTIVAGFVLA